MSTFKVMTWNVENLYQPGGNYGPKTQAEYALKLDSLVMAIQRLDPDVLALQEIGDAASLNDLATTAGYTYTTLGTPDRRGIRVGFLSKLPLGAVTHIESFAANGLASVPGLDDQGRLVMDKEKGLGRGAVQVSIEPKPGFKVRIINLHLKSKLLTYPSLGRDAPRFNPRNEDERTLVGGLALLKRTAEAMTVRTHANALVENSQDALIILGDFNDVPDAATTELFKGPSGSEIDSTSRAFNTPDRDDDTRLFNLAPCIGDVERQYSRIHNGKKELIDHIFASVEFFPGNPRRTPDVDSHVNLFEELPSVGDNPTPRLGKPGSDHAPVTAVFEI